jgi:type II secretory pathway predicted ATPase ExeA/pSer/pThr/pTyr-binding forkhead associated (FHA) protein
MYLDLFKLKDLPFRLSPDPEFLYLSRIHARAKAYMESTIWFTDGFVVITGEIGSGKTTLIETFLSEIDRDVVVAQINQTQLSAIEFLQSVLVQFGFSPFRMKKAELLATLNQFLVEQYAARRKVLLIVDEAQNLTNRVLEEIRLLSGVETTREKVLRIILAGQPELNANLDAPELVQLVQRIRLRFHLTALTGEETRGYIRHRLEVAGAEGREIFVEDTYPEIIRYTGGVPRLINTLCDTAMMAAYAADQDQVTLASLSQAIAELQWVDFAERRTLQREKLSQQRPPTAPAAAPVFVPAEADPASTVILARVVLTSEGRTVREVPLSLGRKIIGRTTDNDVQIDNRFVSRHHCQIITSPESCVIEDLNSTNGIFVKGRRVHRFGLNDGDLVTIGKHELTYFDERAQRSRASVDTSPGIPALALAPDPAAPGQGKS